jgi:CRISPR type IV-associated DEAD/DEAH-box helicase Csf4
MNRTLTHRRRVEDPRDSVPHEMLSAALLLQQGIGRLVRRDGLPRNRRIFLLDGRLADPAFDAYLALCKRALEPYPQQFLRPEDISSKRATVRRKGETNSTVAS